MLDLSPWGAVGLSLATVFLAWLAYEVLCRSALGENDVVLATVGFFGLLLVAFAMTRMFSGRRRFSAFAAAIARSLSPKRTSLGALPVAPGSSSPRPRPRCGKPA